MVRSLRLGVWRLGCREKNQENLLQTRAGVEERKSLFGARQDQAAGGDAHGTCRST